MFCKIISPSNDIHKIPTIPTNYQDLHNIVQRKFHHEIPQSFLLKYKDSEDEMIMLSTDDDLLTAIETSQTDNVKTLRVFIIPHHSTPVDFHYKNLSYLLFF